MQISLEQVDRPGRHNPLWKVFLPKESVSQEVMFDEIKDFIMGSALGYPIGDFQTEVVERNGGIEVTFAVERDILADLPRVFEWIGKPRPYAR